ncbi:MAG: cobyrinate a,c-diamide synthase, partial [Planctomycetes bacterium]|nr:cobyrinate a,c-diamide synthase [Planctomycetota bacterium]
MAYRLPRLLLAAPASGNGKTTVTIALLQALLNRGLRPAAFKCGPDYIDPMFHREVLGIPGYNLDLFFTPHHMVGALLQAGGRDADIAVIEGAMGYYDGVADTDEASAYRVAAATETMTVLVLQPGGACLSLAALVQGFARFRAESRIAGIILNRCSARLHDKVAPMLERETGLPVFGLLPNLADASLGSRHLGLVTPGDMADLRGKIAVLGKHAAECVDIDKLIALAHKAPELHNNLPTVPASAEAVRIAVAWDAAFCFYYRENFELLEKLGAELVYFSPLHDAVLPENIGGLYLGGGYPELHADRLAANNTLR